ncbi:putative membrane protein [Lachnospiraceae bacterium PF1-21]
MKNRSLKQKIQVMITAMRRERRQHRSSFIVYIVLRALVLLTMILQIFNRNYENVFLCLLTLLLLIVPSFIQVNLKIEIPTAFEITILLFIFAAEILGEISAFYIQFPFWDTILHTINGFLMAAIGFALADLLNRQKKVSFHLAPSFLAIVAFCFSMTIGVLWEFFEWGMDSFFGLDMQKDTLIHELRTVYLDPTRQNVVVTIKDITSTAVNGQDLGIGGYLDVGLRDTMMDLLVNFVGAVIFSILGYFYVKYRNKKSLAKKFIPVHKKEEEDFLMQAINEMDEEESKKER